MDHTLKILGALLASIAVLSGATPPSVTVYDSFENSTDGTILTGTIAANASLGGAGSWKTENEGSEVTPLTQVTISTSRFNTLRGPVKVGTTNIFGTGDTRCIKVNNNNIDWELIKYTLPAATNIVTAGFAIYFSSARAGWHGSSHSYDLSAIEGPSGGFLVLNYFNNTCGELALEVQGSVQLSPWVCLSTLGLDDKWIWVSEKWDAVAHRATMILYDTTTWRQVLNTNLALDANVGEKASFVSVGRYDNHGTSDDADCYYDTIIISENGAIWPVLPPGATVQALSATQTDVSNAVYYASYLGDNTYFDSVTIPAGSNVWTMDLQITNAVDIRGAGTNWDKTVIRFNGSGAGSQDSVLSLKYNYARLHDMQVRADPANLFDRAWPIRFRSNYCSISNMYLIGFLSPIISDVPIGVVYNSTFFNGQRGLGRSFGTGTGQANWDAMTPWNNSTSWAANFFFTWEDNKTILNDATLPAMDIITSQQGEIYMARNNTIIMTTTGGSLQPAFDIHGETDPGPLRGGIAVLIYSNLFVCSGGASIDKFIDIRGGRCRSYSNVVQNITTGLGNYMRIKDNETANWYPDMITNCSFYANTENGSPMSINVEPNDAAVIVAGLGFTNVESSPYTAPPYPHFLRTFGAGSGSGNPGSPLVTPAPPGAITRMRIGR